MHSPVWYLLKNTLMQINPKSNEKGPMITYSTYNHLNHMINRHSSLHGEIDPFQHKFSRISFCNYFVAFFSLLFWLKLWNGCRSKCYFLLTNTGVLKRLKVSLIRWLVGSFTCSFIVRYHGSIRVGGYPIPASFSRKSRLLHFSEISFLAEEKA